LSGDFLEVIPGLADGEACPAVTWDGASVSRNQASITGLDVECGWKVSGLEVPAGGAAQVTAKVSVSPADQQALDAWLRAGSEATTAATQDPAVKGTAYTVQRLKGVEVRTPARVVTPSPLKITLLPVCWFVAFQRVLEVANAFAHTFRHLGDLLAAKQQHRHRENNQKFRQADGP